MNRARGAAAPSATSPSAAPSAHRGDRAAEDLNDVFRVIAESYAQKIFLAPDDIARKLAEALDPEADHRGRRQRLEKVNLRAGRRYVEDPAIGALGPGMQPGRPKDGGSGAISLLSVRLRITDDIFDELYRGLEIAEEGDTQVLAILPHDLNGKGPLGANGQ